MRRLGYTALAIVAQNYPKQFARLLSDDSLLQASARRLSGPGYTAPIVVNGSEPLQRDRTADGRGCQPASHFDRTRRVQHRTRRPCGGTNRPGQRHRRAAARCPLGPCCAGHRRIPRHRATRHPCRTGRADRHLWNRAGPPGNRLWLSGARGRRKDRPPALKRFIEKPDQARAEKMLA